MPNWALTLSCRDWRAFSRCPTLSHATASPSKRLQRCHTGLSLHSIALPLTTQALTPFSAPYVRIFALIPKVGRQSLLSLLGEIESPVRASQRVSVILVTRGGLDGEMVPSNK